VQDPLPAKLLVDADAWQFGGKTKLIFYIFCPPMYKKTFPRHWLYVFCETILAFMNFCEYCFPGLNFSSSTKDVSSAG